MSKSKKPSNFQEQSLREQLNTVIALLLILVGEKGQKEILKKRRANDNLVRYLGDKLGLSNKDLSGILNTTESGISNLRAKRKRGAKRKRKK